MRTNSIRNPSAEGSIVCLVNEANASTSIVADSATGEGARSYRIALTSAAPSSARTHANDRTPATEGTRVWARARCRLDPTVIGARRLSARVTFRDSAGTLLPYSQPAIGQSFGARNRWVGREHSSASERLENGLVRRNHAQNPVGVRGWTAWPGSGGTTRVDYLPGSGLPFADNFVRATSTQAATGALVGPGTGEAAVTLVAGQTYTFSAWGRSNRQGSSHMRVRGTAFVGEITGPLTTHAAGEWECREVTVTATSDGGATIYFWWNLVAAVGDTYDVTALLSEDGDSASDFFYGGTPDTGDGITDQESVDLVPSGVFHRWSGAVNNSTSERWEGTSRRVNDALDPLFTNPTQWYRQPKATADFTTPGSVVVTATQDWAAGDLLTYPAPNLAAVPGEIKGSRYRIRNAGQTTVEVYGNNRGYGTAALANPDGPTSSGVVIAPGATVEIILPTFVVPAEATGYRPLLRARVMPSGSVLVVDQPMFETLSIGQTPGTYFDASMASTGTGNTQDVVEFLVVGDAPAGAVSADLVLQRDSPYGSANGDAVYADRLLLTATRRVVPEYHDGSSTPPFTAWTGAANASTSTYIETMPDLDVDASAWQVGIRFGEVFAATQTMTVTALTPDGEYPVRGGDRAYAVGGLTLIDYEAPPGVPVTYLGHMFAADGTELGYTEGTSGRYDIDPSMAIFSDPLVPGNAVLVEAQEPFAGRKVRKRQGSTFRVGNRTIALYAPLGLLEGINLNVQTKRLEDADALERVLDAMPVLVRSMPRARIPRQLYVAIESPEVADVDVQYGGEWTEYPLVGNEVSRSVTDIVVPVVTWQTYLDAFPTWAAFNAAYATWLDAQQNPPEDENARAGR